jgi:hypothetical protein
MTKSPSPSVDEVAEGELSSWLETLDSCLETFWAITEPGTDSRLLAEGAQDAAKAIASLVSPPKAGSGEPVGFINAQGGFLLTDAGAEWFKTAMANAGPAPVGIAALPLYANHEARGDGVRVTDDLFTHREAWRTGLVLAKHSSQPPTVDMDDRAYWQHEIDVFDRVFAALEAALPPLGDGRAEIVEAVARAIDKHIDAAPVDGINAEGDYNLNVFNQQQSYVDGLKVARLAAIRSLSNPGGGLS